MKDPFDSREIFDLIREINDPEHPLTLEQLNVVELDKIDVNDEKSTVSEKEISVAFSYPLRHLSFSNEM